MKSLKVYLSPLAEQKLLALLECHFNRTKENQTNVIAEFFGE